MSLFSPIFAALVACVSYLAYQKYVTIYTSFVVKPLKSYDYIVVGAGTSGCVLAARLSEDPMNTVLLIEAGDHMGYFTRVPLTATAAQQGPNDWAVKTTRQKYSSFGMFNQTQFIPRGKGLGGSGQINFLLHGFGLPSDFRWSRLGFKGWSYEDLKGYFVRAFGTVRSEFDSDHCPIDGDCPGAKEDVTMKRELEKIAYMYGDVQLKHQRRKRQKHLIVDLFLDYATHSTLHGLRYIAEKGITVAEKLFWVATFITSIVLCSFLINNVYVKWRTSPVIVTVSEKLVPVSNMPFPSVTICPQIKSKASVYNYISHREIYAKHYFPRRNYDGLDMFEDISTICGYPLYTNGPSSLYSILTNSSMIDHITEVAPTASNVFYSCSWRNKYVDCQDLFETVYTAEGVCFNMNGLAADEMFRDTVQHEYNYSSRSKPSRGWSMERGYYSDDDPFPKRGNENGATPDFSVVLFSHSTDVDGICNGANSGYRIYLHHPADIAQTSMYYYAAVDDHVTSLAISVHVLNTSDTLAGYPPETRQCYFPGERYLRYFQIYTNKNCRAECLSNYTFDMCQCVGFYMVHDNSSQICGHRMTDCMLEAHETMVQRELRLGAKEDRRGCRCLPACESVEYDAEVLKTEYNMLKLEKLLSMTVPGYEATFEVPETLRFSKVELYSKKPQFLSMRRSELFGLTDFLANIGGLLGVFLGFSFLSIVEIFYFLTLKLGLVLKRDLKEENNSRKTSKSDKDTKY